MLNERWMYETIEKKSTWKMLLAGTDKKSLMPCPRLLAKPMGLPITPAEPNTCQLTMPGEQL